MLHRRTVLLLAGLLLLLGLACNLFGLLSGNSNNNNNNNNSNNVNSSAPSSLSISGAQSKSAFLPDPTVGLSGLKSYHASLHQTINGTLDGQPYQSSTDLEYSRAASQDEELIRSASASGDSDRFQATAHIAGAAYIQLAKDASCQGSPLDPQESALPVPAGQLVPVLSADKVGSETVNSLPAVHYRFNQAGLPITEKNLAVTGELWIADPGGFVVKYTLSFPAPSNPSGQGLQAGENWDYELSQANAIDQVALPDGCQALPLDIPTTADAQNVAYAGGQLSFTTTSAQSQLVDFYTQKLPAAGWKLESSSSSKDNKSPSLLFFTKGQQELTIILDASSAPLQVIATLSTQSQQQPAVSPTSAMPGSTASNSTATPNASLPSIPALPTASMTQSGLPKDIPLYKGATNIMNAGGGVMFNAPDAPDLVANFYRQQMPTIGWQQVVDKNKNGQETLSWMNGTRMAVVTINTQDGKTHIAIVVTNW